MSNLALNLCENSSIAVISHIDADGDSIGSILGLGLALKQKYNKVKIFIHDSLPNRFTFLGGLGKLYKYEDTLDEYFDCCFVLDCGDVNRLGSSKSILKKSKIIVNIDHHISNTKFGNINIIDVNASSTCEIIYSVIEDMGLFADKEIATCLYTGIVTDSGNFIYDNATSKTHLIAASLIDTNIDKQTIMYNLYQRKSINSLKFLGHSLSNMEAEYDGKLIFFLLPLSLLEEFHISYDDVESIVNYGRDIEGVDISVTLREENDGKTKLSFRSKHDDVDVSALAELFGGGGHRKAAGATLNVPLEEAKMLVIKNANQFIRR